MARYTVVERVTLNLLCIAFTGYDDLVYEDMWSINYPYQPNGDVNTAPAVHDYNQNFGSFRPGPGMGT